MIDTHLKELIEALRSGTDNHALQRLVVNACLEAGDGEALAEAVSIAGGELLPDPGTRQRAADLLLGAGFNDLAMEMAAPDSAARFLAEARITFAAGQSAKARELYDKAVRLNPTLEDAAFGAALSGKVVAFQGRGKGVPSIANDDTAEADVLRLTQPTLKRVTFADVGGLDKVKQQIRRRIITPFLKPSLFERFKRTPGGGILLYGPPGCGKTLLARATAGECGARFFNVAITDVLDMYIGESERKLHELFEQARRSAPSVLFFDEVEAIGGKRQHAREATSAKLVSQFLTELDGFAQGNQGVLILGATNVPWAVDSAFRRPGRFDRVLFVPPPDEPARVAILELNLTGRPTQGPIAVQDIARATSGFSGADLRHLVETAVDEVIELSIEDGTEVPLATSHLRQALRDVRPTTLEWLSTARNHARYANQGGSYDEVLQFLAEHGSP